MELGGLEFLFSTLCYDLCSTTLAGSPAGMEDNGRWETDRHTMQRKHDYVEFIK